MDPGQVASTAGSGPIAQLGCASPVRRISGAVKVTARRSSSVGNRALKLPEPVHFQELGARLPRAPLHPARPPPTLAISPRAAVSRKRSSEASGEARRGKGQRIGSTVRWPALLAGRGATSAKLLEFYEPVAVNVCDSGLPRLASSGSPVRVACGR